MDVFADLYGSILLFLGAGEWQDPAGAQFRVLSTEFRVSSFEFQVSSFKFQVFEAEAGTDAVWYTRGIVAQLQNRGAVATGSSCAPINQRKNLVFLRLE
jgi:hypothetical protein